MKSPRKHLREDTAARRNSASSPETVTDKPTESRLTCPLTGLPNRLHLERRMTWRIENQQPFCVAFVGLNHFKSVNDRHGHTAGDILLKHFANELRTNVRPSDLVGRWSGDEFVVLLDCDLAGASIMIDRVRRWAFGDYTIDLGGDSEKLRVHVDAAIGLAEWVSGETVEQLIGRADLSMYEDKQHPKPRTAGRTADSKLSAQSLQ
jgi:diguanylate cyclase (GGDEF)-like protein